MQHFFFYDVETSGVNPRTDRIMQFAGQRTTMDFRPIGEPHNYLIKLTNDTIPDPEAILLTGITPQKTIDEGITEAEFCSILIRDIAKPNTIFLGFNSLRFDDEFIRFLLWRNFYNPYEWQWKNGRSRWDVLDVVRMTRALRPGDIKWPMDNKTGKPANRLEMLTMLNELDHTTAHDALSDVTATIAIAKLIKFKQPKLFNYLLSMRGKEDVKKFVHSNPIFLYTSGRYASEHEKSTIVGNVVEADDKSGMYVFDLRKDPSPFLRMSTQELLEVWPNFSRKSSANGQILPIKLLKYNRCPAIAPLGVLDDISILRIDLHTEPCLAHYNKILGVKSFITNLSAAIKSNMQKYENSDNSSDEQNAEEQLYNKFVSTSDSLISNKIITSQPQDIINIGEGLQDSRLKRILPRYKARNFSQYLTSEEKANWDAYRRNLFALIGHSSQLERFTTKFQDYSKRNNLTKQDRYLLEELSLYVQSLT